MQTGFKKLVWIILGGIVILATASALLELHQVNAVERDVAETRQTLRQQGFKTDLADFDFSTSAELRAREAALVATTPPRFSEPFHDHPNLMEIIGNDSAIVVWEQPSLKRQYNSRPDNSDQITWDEFRDALNENRPVLDEACEAALSGPIRFNLDARDGDAMRLPHLALMKNLIQTFGSRTMLALHDGNKGEAWTNLLATTRLVTAWEPEPAEISHLVRFGDVLLAFNVSWQALQTNGWSDEQLARLQQEWESVDLFTNLPETTAFKRASTVATCQRDRQEPLSPGVPFSDLLKEMLHSPRVGWNSLTMLWSQFRYRGYGTFMDERALLLFYRDRELELRKAVQAPTWAQMRPLPGVTNRTLFQSKYRSRLQVMLSSRAIASAFQLQGAGLLGRAAEAEARRRILITALALERYRGKHGSYPNALAGLAPEFLKMVPADFMDGQPLRYRLANDGHFLLYSIGLDCVDNGGKVLEREDRMSELREFRATGMAPEEDTVWPLPASTADVAALRQNEKRAAELRNLSAQDRESDEDWRLSPLRQARVEKLLSMNWTPETEMETFAGRRVVDLVGNEKPSGTNRLSLVELMTPKQIITGNEPEELTFQLPVSYDAITNTGNLALLVDADVREPMGDSGGRIQDCNRAGNGDCQLVWHTIFDPPGKHAVQIQLALSTPRGGDYLLKGPPISLVTTNFCQFSLNSATYDVERGAIFRARLPEKNGTFTIECLTTNGTHLATLAGSTTNGEFNVTWNLAADDGHRLTGETFNSVVHITLPDSSRTQTLKGP